MVIGGPFCAYVAGDLLVTASSYVVLSSGVRSTVSSMRKALTVVAMLAAGAALPSCTTDHASETASAPAYERLAHIDRAPLPPPQGYAPDTTSAVPSGSYTDFSIANGTTETGRLTWRASPRWSAVKGNDCVSVEQNARGEFDVANCSPEGAAHRNY
jgi:hypothetical protein